VYDTTEQSHVPAASEHIPPFKHGGLHIGAGVLHSVPVKLVNAQLHVPALHLPPFWHMTLLTMHGSAVVAVVLTVVCVLGGVGAPVAPGCVGPAAVVVVPVVTAVVDGHAVGSTER